MIVNRESRHCPRCDTLAPQRYPYSVITRYRNKLIEFLSCPRCRMPFSREIWHASIQ